MSDDDRSEEAGGNGEVGDPEVDPDADLSDLFEGMETDEIDDDALWEELAIGDEPSPEDGDLFEELAEESPTDHDGPQLDADGEEAVVEKSRYCQGCEYFSDPPEVACNHPGTEIVEMVGVERFRVRNCPIVEKRHGRAKILEED